MARLFRRGELREVTLIVLDELGETHAYAVLAELDSRIDVWKPSPGSVYPALLSIVTSGLATTRQDDGVTLYATTSLGSERAIAARSKTRWASLSSRASETDKDVTLGAVLDQFAREMTARNRLLNTEKAGQLDMCLDRLRNEINQLLETSSGGRDG